MAIPSVPQPPVPIVDFSCVPPIQIPMLCINFPGGASLCIQGGIRTGDLPAWTEAFFGAINSALMPLVPFFNILDVVIAVFNCIQAVPQVVTDPGALVNCIQALAAAIAKVVGMIPQLSIPRLIKDLLLVIGTMLEAIASEIEAFIAQETRIANAATAAAAPGNVHLQSIVDCATGNISLQLQNLNASMAPLNRLVGLINILLALVPGSPTVPVVPPLGSDATAALETVRTAGQTMVEIANMIPIPA